MNTQQSVYSITSNNFSVEIALKTAVSINAASTCKNLSGLRAYLIISHPEIFQITGGNLVMVILARTTSFLMSLMGSFRDLFIMCIAIGLSSRFQQVNKILLAHKGKSMLPSSFWSDQRQYHRKLAGLVYDVDDAISKITMLALSNNLFFMCTSLLNSVE